jgi:hypothetical protein
MFLMWSTCSDRARRQRLRSARVVGSQAATPRTARASGSTPRSGWNSDYHLDGYEGVDAPMSPVKVAAQYADSMLQRPLLFSSHRFDAPSMAEVRSVGGALHSHRRLLPHELCHQVWARLPRYTDFLGANRIA